MSDTVKVLPVSEDKEVIKSVLACLKRKGRAYEIVSSTDEVGVEHAYCVVIDENEENLANFTRWYESSGEKLKEKEKLWILAEKYINIFPEEIQITYNISGISEAIDQFYQKSNEPISPINQIAVNLSELQDLIAEKPRNEQRINLILQTFRDLNGHPDFPFRQVREFFESQGSRMGEHLLSRAKTAILGKEKEESLENSLVFDEAFMGIVSGYHEEKGLTYVDIFAPSGIQRRALTPKGSIELSVGDVIKVKSEIHVITEFTGHIIEENEINDLVNRSGRIEDFRQV